jgi:hypothetical protein
MTEVVVRYRGLEVAKGLTMEGVGPSTAFLPLEEPLPVGTMLELSNDAGVSVSVSVLRVHERVGRGDGAVGVRVAASGLSGDAHAWWQELVSGVDPTIPELALAAGEPVDKASKTEVMSTEAVEAAVAAMEAERAATEEKVDEKSPTQSEGEPSADAESEATASGDGDAEEAESSSKKSRKKRRPRGKKRR